MGKYTSSDGMRNYNHNSNLHIGSSGKLNVYTWNHVSQIHVSYRNENHQEPFVGGGMFSWPPRSYTCSFCKREFRSAQALGGHMNVHRRDRARLRQCSPMVQAIQRLRNSSTFNLNNSPRLESPNPTSIVPPFCSTTLSSPLSTLSSSSHSISTLLENPNPKVSCSIMASKGFNGDKPDDRCITIKEVGVIGDYANEEVDLELRLGPFS